MTGEAEREQVFQDVHVRLQMLPTFPYLAELAEGEGVVSVTVRAAPAALRRLDPDLVVAYVDLQSLASVRVEPGQAAQYREAVRVQLPVNVVWSAATVSPPQVTIVLRNPTD